MLLKLDEIEDKVDMVDIFRAKEFVLDVVKQAISIEARILWTQEGMIWLTKILLF